eukprot:s481_g22.t1
MDRKGMEEEQTALQSYGERFVVCRNRPENDEHWDSEEPEWLGKASMAARHRFLTTKDLRWSFFNALTLGMTEEESDLRSTALSEAIQLLEDLRSAAVTYVCGRRQQGWSEQLGLYFHVFGHNSVNSLHLHMVDMKAVGPTFRKLEYKNCPLNAILKVLQEELAQLSSVPRSLGRIEEVMAEELLELNVGGELVAISEQCFSRNLEVLESLKAKPRDGQGHIFLDLPAAPVKVLLDALRMRQLRQQETKTLQLRCVVDEDLRAVAKVLGFPISGPTQWQPVAVVAGVAGAALAHAIGLVTRSLTADGDIMAKNRRGGVGAEVLRSKLHPPASPCGRGYRHGIKEATRGMAVRLRWVGETKPFPAAAPAADPGEKGLSNR